ncbi:MAG: glycosyltransferase [Gammaproteobacteria bacterium]|nr:glycosyltransferase [Gammaproteobacteria bacterium]
MLVKHSIIMICYNQEKYIRTALDSILNEQVKPYEIIIGDDFSTDKTREILKEYQSKFSEIIKLVFNNKNLGIFENLNKVAPMATGDIISILSGDDWYKPKLIENMNKKLIQLNLNPIKSRFILLPHTVLRRKNGKEKIYRNVSNVLDRYSPVGSVFRGLLHTRHVGLSRALFDKWPLFESDSGDLGLWTDFVHHVLLTQHIERLVIMDCEGPVYCTGVGITSKTSKESLHRSYHAALVRIQRYHNQGQLLLNNVDAKYLEFLIQCRSPNLKFNAASGACVFRATWRLVREKGAGIGSIGKELLLVIKRVFLKH